MENSEIPGSELNATVQPKPSRKKTPLIFALVILLVIGVGAFVAHRHSTKAKPAAVSQTAVADAAEVTISKDGFSPATVQIHKGQNVTWTNQDSAVHQIAADPHPSHSSLPELVGEPLNMGDTYSFPFEKTGTYTYHDELNPLQFSGTVIVK